MESNAALKTKTDMKEEFKGSGIEYYTAGDAQKAGNVYTCVHSAYDIARMI